GNAASLGDLLLKNMAGEFSIVQGIFYWQKSGEQVYRPEASYALVREENTPPVHPGTGLTGQAAADGKVVVIHPVPENYGVVASGLGQSSPAYVYIVPFVFEGKTMAILEVSTFRPIENDGFTALEMITTTGGLLMNEMNNLNA
ncbi:MAG TPA: GAF domain-containing protein, partial [Bacteroidales bacterium]|nr:GAF domain-containing protein [Bacteroidales bacterium]